LAITFEPNSMHAGWPIKGSKAGVYNLLLLPAALLLLV